MNKLFIVFLAICLVSVHAFVKRDTNDDFKKITEQLQDIGKQIGDKVSETINPEQIQKGLNDLLENIKKAMEQKPEAAKQ